MFQNLPFMMQNNVFFRALLGFSWAAGPPSSPPQLGRGKLLAIVIIPNLAGMFNDKLTFFEKYSQGVGEYRRLGPCLLHAGIQAIFFSFDLIFELFDVSLLHKSVYKKDMEGPSLQLKNSYIRTFIADIRNI